jgi:predicted O-methyltransferase YrrM
VEVGTFRGGSAALLAQAFRLLGDAGREMHVVDTFVGHLDETPSDYDDSERQRGKFQDTSFEEVQRLLSSLSSQVQVHKGDAAAVIAGWPERQYSLVHIDVDLYQPMIECLDYFGPRLVAGGIIVADDYEAPTCPGVAQAVHEYLGRTPGLRLWRMQSEQVVLIKR